MTHPKCKCGGQMLPGKALAQTFTAGTPDFPGDDTVSTFSAGGPGKMIDCLKCEDCGHSMTQNKPETIWVVHDEGSISRQELPELFAGFDKAELKRFEICYDTEAVTYTRIDLASDRLQELLSAAVAKERERCANICAEQWICEEGVYPPSKLEARIEMANELAALIRESE